MARASFLTPIKITILYCLLRHFHEGERGTRCAPLFESFLAMYDELQLSGVSECRHDGGGDQELIWVALSRLIAASLLREKSSAGMMRAGE